MNPQTLLQQAIAFHQTGKLAEAEQLYRDVMRQAPRDPSAPHLLGVVRAQQGRAVEALELIGSALALKPDAPEMLSNQGNVLKTLGRFDEALASYDRALAVKPDYVAAVAKRAQVLRDLGRSEDALAAADAALKMNPGFWEAHSTRGVVLSDLGRHGEALAAYDRALGAAPQFPDVWNNRALTLKSMKRLAEALANAERALTLHGDFAEAWNNRGIILFELKRTGEAIASYDRALELRPDYAEALNNRAVALASLKRFSESLADCDRAMLIHPGFADALYNRGNALSELGRPEDALVSYEQALAHDPAHPNALSGLANAALLTGNWARTAKLADVLKDDVLAGRSVIQPFVLMGYHDDNDLQLRCSRNYVRQAGPGPQAPLWTGQKYAHDKIRIAYLSADFHQHVTAALTVEMFERHDRERFEITAVSFGPDDGSDMRARLVKAFDRFQDARAQTDREVAQLLRQWEIDIAVDLGGHTSGARPWVLTDTTVEVPPAPTRAEAGLPDSGFVFCCFNHNWKITAPLFDIWMRLLTQVDGSVLWLLEGNAAIRGNLQREAEARGVDPSRLIFAARTTPQKHLARQQLADLFLDTLPYNAHTTASDALWAGLPVVTVPGRSYPARVAASILRAADLAELIAPDLPAYEALALRLTQDKDALGGVRRKLAAVRSTPLFDTARFTRNLEAAYRTMLEQA